MSPGTKKEMPIVQVDHQRAGRGKLTSGLKKAARGQGRALGGQSCVVAPTGRSSRQEMDGAAPGVPVCISGRDGGGMTVEPLQHSLPQMRMGPGVRGGGACWCQFHGHREHGQGGRSPTDPTFLGFTLGSAQVIKKPLYQLPTKHFSLLKKSEPSFAAGSFLSYIG